MFALLLATLLHPNPDVAESRRVLRPGFRFQYWNYRLEIYRVEGDRYWLRFPGDGNRVDGGRLAGNPFGRWEIEKVLRECPQGEVRP